MGFKEQGAARKFAAKAFSGKTKRAVSPAVKEEG